MIETLFARASSLARLVEPPLGSFLESLAKTLCRSESKSVKRWSNICSIVDRVVSIDACFYSATPPMYR